jgi:hypothetical protein
LEAADVRLVDIPGINQDRARLDLVAAAGAAAAVAGALDLVAAAGAAAAVAGALDLVAAAGAAAAVAGASALLRLDEKCMEFHWSQVLSDIIQLCPASGLGAKGDELLHLPHCEPAETALHATHVIRSAS